MAGELAERLRQAVAGLEIAVGSETLRVTCSLGCAVVVGEALLGETVEAVLQRADAALYRAKFSGRNRVELDATLMAPRAAD